MPQVLFCICMALVVQPHEFLVGLRFCGEWHSSRSPCNGLQNCAYSELVQAITYTLFPHLYLFARRTEFSSFQPCQINASVFLAARTLKRKENSNIGT